jgi:hypothetical protein
MGVHAIRASVLLVQVVITVPEPLRSILAVWLVIIVLQGPQIRQLVPQAIIALYRHPYRSHARRHSIVRKDLPLQPPAT